MKASDPQSAKVPSDNQEESAFTHQSTINGWGRTTSTRVHLECPTSEHRLQDLLTTSLGPVTVRGAGRSYGDAAIGPHTIDLTGLATIRSFDPATGIIFSDAGATLQALHQVSVPQGWALPVLPGTSRITLGGAIASDVHGKNHMHQGSFGHHVLEMELMLASGSLLRISPDTHSEEFCATVGGMGLTGVIVSAAIQLLCTETPYLRVFRRKAETLEAAMDLITDSIRTPSHAVAWVDATREDLRGLVEVSTPASTQMLSERMKNKLPPAPGISMRNIRTFPGRGIVNDRSIRWANAVRWNLPLGAGPRIVHFTAALNPLDGASFWPAAFGSQGLIQYQFCVPTCSHPVLREILEGLQSSGLIPALAVLKRFGACGNGLLSFPQPGWTLALDFPAHYPGLAAALGHLDTVVANAGGRVYLSKDNRLPAEMVPLMYPQLQRWQGTRARLDPTHKMGSLLSQRLNLLEL
ncbi:FAD-binding protein [Paeniglutamicibacter cryotolerans]|uniref:Decaprenylphospho-beta-D-ribofuranose 2-oxidase n=1 Tax=Paeniglutamicibacter cryotolerans TaxID=670079 RepID=A0A839QNT1_9MICC|nr:FAD-binding oxidoreductase [Paeniglutamicibacter cryotolerans]MBB2997577.1 decaprenylphospho-beta-D-ribofuranose 2-oxidase [Paeniglutamicibacter cryotolerans]